MYFHLIFVVTFAVTLGTPRDVIVQEYMRHVDGTFRHLVNAQSLDEGTEKIYRSERHKKETRGYDYFEDENESAFEKSNTKDGVINRSLPVIATNLEETVPSKFQQTSLTGAAPDSSRHDYLDKKINQNSETNGRIHEDFDVDVDAEESARKKVRNEIIDANHKTRFEQEDIVNMELKSMKSRYNDGNKELRTILTVQNITAIKDGYGVLPINEDGEENKLKKIKDIKIQESQTMSQLHAVEKTGNTQTSTAKLDEEDATHNEEEKITHSTGTFQTVTETPKVQNEVFVMDGSLTTDDGEITITITGQTKGKEYNNSKEIFDLDLFLEKSNRSMLFMDNVTPDITIYKLNEASYSQTKESEENEINAIIPINDKQNKAFLNEFDNKQKKVSFSNSYSQSKESEENEINAIIPINNKQNKAFINKLENKRKDNVTKTIPFRKKNQKRMQYLKTHMTDKVNEKVLAYQEITTTQKSPSKSIFSNLLVSKLKSVEDKVNVYNNEYKIHYPITTVHNPAYKIEENADIENGTIEQNPNTKQRVLAKLLDKMQSSSRTESNFSWRIKEQRSPYNVPTLQGETQTKNSLDFPIVPLNKAAVSFGHLNTATNAAKVPTSTSPFPEKNTDSLSFNYQTDMPIIKVTIQNLEYLENETSSVLDNTNKKHNLANGASGDSNEYEDDKDLFENEPIYTPEFTQSTPKNCLNNRCSQNILTMKVPRKPYKTRLITERVLNSLLKLNPISLSDVPLRNQIDREKYWNKSLSLYEALVRITIDVLLDKSSMINKTFYQIIDNVSNNDTNVVETNEDIANLMYSESFLKAVFSKDNIYEVGNESTPIKYSYPISNGESFYEETNSQSDDDSFDNEPVFSSPELYEYIFEPKHLVENILKIILNKKANETSNVYHLSKTQLKNSLPAYKNVINTVLRIFRNKTRDYKSLQNVGNGTSINSTNLAENNFNKDSISILPTTSYKISLNSRRNPYNLIPQAKTTSYEEVTSVTTAASDEIKSMNFDITLTAPCKNTEHNNAFNVTNRQIVALPSNYNKKVHTRNDWHLESNEINMDGVQTAEGYDNVKPSNFDNEVKQLHNANVFENKKYYKGNKDTEMYTIVKTSTPLTIYNTDGIAEDKVTDDKYLDETVKKYENFVFLDTSTTDTVDAFIKNSTDETLLRLMETTTKEINELTKSKESLNSVTGSFALQDGSEDSHFMKPTESMKTRDSIKNITTSFYKWFLQNDGNTFSEKNSQLHSKEVTGKEKSSENRHNKKTFDDIQSSESGLLPQFNQLRLNDIDYDIEKNNYGKNHTLTTKEPFIIKITSQQSFNEDSGNMLHDNPVETTDDYLVPSSTTLTGTANLTKEILDTMLKELLLLNDLEERRNSKSKFNVNIKPRNSTKIDIHDPIIEKTLRRILSKPRIPKVQVLAYGRKFESKKQKTKSYNNDDINTFRNTKKQKYFTKDKTKNYINNINKAHNKLNYEEISNDGIKDALKEMDPRRYLYRKPLGKYKNSYTLNSLGKIGSRRKIVENSNRRKSKRRHRKA